MKTCTTRNSSIICVDHFYPENSKDLYQLYVERTKTERLSVVNPVTRHRRTNTFSYKWCICHSVELSI